MTSKVADTERAVAIEGVRAAWAAAEATVPADELSPSDIKEIAALLRDTTNEQARDRAFLYEGLPLSDTSVPDGDDADRLQADLREQDVYEISEALLGELVDLDALDVGLELINGLPATNEEERTLAWNYRRSLVSALIERTQFKRAIQLTADLFGKSTLDYASIIADLYKADPTPSRLEEARRLIAERILLNTGKRNLDEASKAWAILWFMTRDSQDLEMARGAARLLSLIDRATAISFLAEVTGDAGDFLAAFQLLNKIQKERHSLQAPVAKRVFRLIDILRLKMSNEATKSLHKGPPDLSESTTVTLDQARGLHEQLLVVNPRWAELVRQLIVRTVRVAEMTARRSVPQAER